MINARAVLAVLSLVACSGMETGEPSTSGSSGYFTGGKSSAGGTNTNIGGGGTTEDPTVGAPNGSTGSNICADAGVCPAGECCAGACCTIGQMCCNGRCIMPTVDTPSCMVTF